MNYKLRDLPLIISSLLIAAYSVLAYTQYLIWSNPFWYAINLILLVAFFLNFRRNSSLMDPVGVWLFKAYIFWVIVSIARGAIIANGYWQWKSLFGNSFCLLLPICFALPGDVSRFGDVLRFYIRYTIPLALLILVFGLEGYGLFLALIPFLILFIPYVSDSKKLVIILAAVSVIVFDHSMRSIVIKILVPSVLVLGYPLRGVLSKPLFEVARKILFVAPILLFVLGVCGVFNVFDMNSYTKSGKEIMVRDGVTGETRARDLRSDTRSFLYRDVLATATKYNSWLLGRTPAHGNETEAFADGATLFSENGIAERTMNESSVLNIFMWTGLIGLVMYSLVFYRSSWLSVNMSSNYFGKCLGVFIAFRWAYSWAEEINYFSLSYFSLWLMVGAGLSKWVQKFTDEDIRDFARYVTSGKEMEVRSYVDD